MKKIKVLYIGGSGRSGSTLLERLINELNGFFGVGEVCFFVERGLENNELCSCGKRFKECEFWNQVSTRVFDNIRLNLTEILNARRGCERIRYIPQLLFPALRTKPFKKNLSIYTTFLRNLYKTISDVSQSNIIIDSSKLPLYAFVLNTISEIELYVVHLIRDSRAVAFSWQKKKRRYEIPDNEVFMPIYPIRYSAKEWNKINMMFALTKNIFHRYILVKYEDFTKDPYSTLKNICYRLGVYKEDNLLFLKKDNVAFTKEFHSLSGNPIRFQNNEIKIALDNNWQREMSLYQKYLVSFITYPTKTYLDFLYNRQGLKWK